MDRAQYQKFATVDAHHWWFRARRHIVASLMQSMWGKPPQNLKIVDIGTGSGGFVPVLTRWGHLTATEPDHDQFVYTQSRFANSDKNLTFKEGGWETLELPANNFDLLTAFDVLEHCEDDRAALTKWRGWLKVGGVMILTVPAFPSLWGLNDEVSHHYRRYTKAPMLQAMNEANMVVSKISYCNSVLFAPVWISRNIKDQIQRKFSKEAKPVPWDFDLPPAPINYVLEQLFSCESGVLKHTNLPWGTSLLVVAHKRSQ